MIVIGGTEASLRCFVHYDYWQNRLRKPILFDSRADILVYGSAEKQIIEIAEKIKNKVSLKDIPGTCVIVKDSPKSAIRLPDYEEVIASKERFCDMQNMLSNNKDIFQRVGDRFVVQYKSPDYKPKDLDEYYSLEFTRIVPKELRGFQFSVVTHRGCFGNCSFCSLALHQGTKIISRSEESILNEIRKITEHKDFRGYIDDLGGPSANMYGMDCSLCKRECMECMRLDKSHKKLITLLQKARAIPKIKNIFVRSGIRYDLATKEYIKEMTSFHVSHKMKIAPEHVNKNVLQLMNKNTGNLEQFIKEFNEISQKLSTL